ncbi:MAG TPA: hypothetical protein PL131_14130 [Methylotenera sp.]|jgi:hypothetical protein|nr:hypothetical protein [Methylotenera sp.]HPN02098.1 hypothetical protein [Methylotenera sp.]
MTITNDTIIALLTKADADAQSVVANLREVYGQSAPLLNLLIAQELEAAVHLRQHIHSILDGVKLENVLNQ